MTPTLTRRVTMRRVIHCVGGVSTPAVMYTLGDSACRRTGIWRRRTDGEPAGANDGADAGAALSFHHWRGGRDGAAASPPARPVRAADYLSYRPRQSRNGRSRVVWCV